MGVILEKFTELKAILKSKTIWGVIITAIFTALKMLLPDVPVEEHLNEIGELAEGAAVQADAIYLTVGQIVGMVISVYGRIVAKAKLILG